MKTTNWLIGIFAVAALAGCSSEPDKYDVDEIDVVSDPAFIYCVEQGHKLEKFSENGERVTYCVMSEDEKQNVWEYYENRDKQEQ
jgi:putative hemolysin